MTKILLVEDQDKIRSVHTIPASYPLGKNGFDLFANKPISILDFCEELWQLSRESQQ